MKILYALFAAAILALGVLHMATTFRLSSSPVAKVWFFGAGMALALAGVLNFLNRRYGLAAFGLRAACIGRTSSWSVSPASLDASRAQVSRSKS